MVTLREILGSSEFSYLSLLNSKANLEREIHAVDTTETPDVAEHTPQHTFLLTTGMAFQNEPEEFCAFISSLDQLPIAGIGIKLGRYIEGVDPRVIEHANKLGFPLISIPKEVMLWTVSQRMISYLWNNKAGEMQMALSIQRQFSEMMLKGATIDSFIKYLGTILNIPIVLQNPFFTVLSASQHYNTSRFSIHQFKDDFDSIWKDHNYRELKTLLKSAFENEDYYIYPIKIEPLTSYYLTFKKKEKEPFHLSNLMLEQMNFVLSHSIYRNLKSKEEYINAKKPFFNRLLNRDNSYLDKNKDWLEYGEEFNLIQSDYYRIAVCRFYANDIPFTNPETKQVRLNLMYSWFEQEIAAIDESTVLFPMDNFESFGLLLQSNDVSLETVFDQMDTFLQKVSPFKLRFYIGNPVLSLHDIHYSYKETLEVAKMEEEKTEDELFVYYETKKTQDLFHNIPNHVKRNFCLTTLKELAFPEEQTFKELRQTLKVFLDSQSSIQLSSERLFVHRNTVVYRIDKCKDLLGSTLEDPQETLNLRVALEMTENHFI